MDLCDQSRVRRETAGDGQENDRSLPLTERLLGAARHVRRALGKGWPGIRGRALLPHPALPSPFFQRAQPAFIISLSTAHQLSVVNEKPMSPVNWLCFCWRCRGVASWGSLGVSMSQGVKTRVLVLRRDLPPPRDEE